VCRRAQASSPESVTVGRKTVVTAWNGRKRSVWVSTFQPVQVPTFESLLVHQILKDLTNFTEWFAQLAQPNVALLQLAVRQCWRIQYLRLLGRGLLSEVIGYGVENQMMSVDYLLDIVLNHRCSTEDLDVDRHAPAVKCGGRPGGEMSR
jgi:hypothetical protein